MPDVASDGVRIHYEIKGIPQHARDMARIVEAVGCGPIHAAGSSTGGGSFWQSVTARYCAAQPSAEIAARIPGAGLVMLDGGQFIFLEQPHLLHDTVEGFIARHE